jgi:hypothetical protein
MPLIHPEKGEFDDAGEAIATISTELRDALHAQLAKYELSAAAKQDPGAILLLLAAVGAVLTRELCQGCLGADPSLHPRLVSMLEHLLKDIAAVRVNPSRLN